MASGTLLHPQRFRRGRVPAPSLVGAAVTEKTNGRAAFGLQSDALILLLVLSLANGSNYLFHVVMTRQLGPGGYGALSALLGALWVASVPMGALQAVAARRTAALRVSDASGLQALLRPALRLALAVGTAGGLALLVSSPWSAGFLRLGSPLPLVAVAAAMIPGFVSAVGRGALQGAQRFGPLATSIFLPVLLRLALGTVLVGAGLGVTGALLATLAAEIAGMALALGPVSACIAGPKGTSPTMTELFHESLKTAGALFALWLLVSLDVVFARHYLDARAAGHYAAASLLGKATVFVAHGVAMVAYPRFASGGGSGRLLRRSCVLVCTVGLVISLGAALFPGLLTFAFGDDFQPAGPVLSLVALGMTGLGVVSIVSYQRLAVGRSPAAILWLAVGIETVGVALSHRGPLALATTVAAVAWLTAIFFILQKAPREAARPLPMRPSSARRASAVELTVITPTYNGAASLPSTLDSILRSLRSAGTSHEVIVVSDGSTDGTDEAARRFEGEELRLIHYPKNQGKGYALREGLARARGRYVAFIDSDGDLDPSDLLRFLALMRIYKADLIVGSKRHPCSRVSYPTTRRIMSWTYHKLIRALFGIGIRDTQTGIKLIRHDPLREVLPRLRERRYAFDLELIVALRRAGYRRVFEAPVNLRFQFESTISVRAVAGIIRDTLVVWTRCYLARSYDSEQLDKHLAEQTVFRPGLSPVRVPTGGI